MTLLPVSKIKYTPLVLTTISNSRSLKSFAPFQDLFLGHAIQDTQAAIIHHFAFHDDPSQFSFPDFAAGWAISSSLLKRWVQGFVTQM